MLRILRTVHNAMPQLNRATFANVKAAIQPLNHRNQGDDDESREVVILLERDQDLECGIDSDEVVSLINEVRTEEDEAHLNSVTVAGRRLRARVHESTKL